MSEIPNEPMCMPAFPHRFVFGLVLQRNPFLPPDLQDTASKYRAAQAADDVRRARGTDTTEGRMFTVTAVVSMRRCYLGGGRCRRW